MPDTPRIRMGSKYRETPANVFNDFDWIHAHKRELLEQYGECSIIVYKERVIGVGNTYKEALENAEHNLPPEMTEVITPVHQILRHPNPFRRAWIKAALRDYRLSQRSPRNTK